MRSFILLFSLTAILIAPFAIAEEPEVDDIELQIDAAELQLHLNSVEMEIQQQNAEMEFQQQVRELELTERRLEVERLEKQHGGGGFVLILLLCLIVHILAAAWVYTDINSRKAGSGLWIVITLIAGLMGALVYAVVRLGDMHPASSQ